MDHDAFTISTTQDGPISISRDAVVQIVGNAVAQSYGVVAFSGQTRMSRLFPWGVRKGIDVELRDEGLVVDVRVVVEHGLKLAEVSDAVRERVLYELGRMVGLPVASLEVHIEKVR